MREQTPEPVRFGNHVDVQDGENVGGAAGEQGGVLEAPIEIRGFGVAGDFLVAACVPNLLVGGNRKAGFDGGGKGRGVAVVEEDDSDAFCGVVQGEDCADGVEC